MYSYKLPACQLLSSKNKKAERLQRPAFLDFVHRVFRLLEVGFVHFSGLSGLGYADLMRTFQGVFKRNGYLENTIFIFC